MTVTTAPPVDRRRSINHGRPRLHERDDILGECEAIFSRALPVVSTCIVIEGPWGSGRTALFNAVCEVAGDTGAVVLRARGGELEKRSPLGILGRFIESATTLAVQRGASPELTDQLDTLVGTVTATPLDVPRISARFYALVVALRELAPVLLAVDDADLADRETLAVLQYVARRLERRDIWLLVSTRPLSPGVGLRPVDALLTEPGTRLFSLEPLRSESVRAILAEYFGQDPDPALVTACREVTGGKPFFLNALLASLGSKRPQPTADLAGRVGDLPAPRITQIVLGRLSLLPVAASDLLQAAAILGDGADPTVARRLAKIDPLAAERALDAAAQMELLEHGRPIVFSSPLIRSAVYQDIPTARRSQLHHRAAQLLAEHGFRESAVARHLLATEPGGEPDTAAWLQQVGRSALASGDCDLALRCLGRALAEPPPIDRRGGVYLDLASAELARKSPAALAHFRRAVQVGGAEDGEIVRVAVELLRGLVDPPEVKAEALLAVRAVAGHLQGVQRELQIEFELALSMASSHPAQLSRGLGRLELLLSQPGDNQLAAPRMARTFITIHRIGEVSGITADEVADTLGTIIDAGQLVGQDPVATKVQTMACYGLLCADRFEQVDHLLRAAHEQARSQGLLQEELDLSLLSTVSFLWQGSLTAAENDGRHGRNLVAQLGGGQWGRPSLGLVDALVRQGRVVDALKHSDDLAPEEIEDPIIRAAARGVLGRLLMAQGLVPRAVTEFLGAGENIVGAGILNPAFNTWRTDAAMALAALQAWDEAASLADEHVRLARSFGAVRTIGIGLRAQAAATPDLSARIERLTEAVDLLEPSPARLEAASALIELGTALVDAKEKEGARSVLRRGANLASVCGAHQLVEAAGTQLRAAGARPRRLGTIGADSLTPAEMRVVRLAADGKTNQGIAEALYVTVKTVEGHLAKAYRKLGVESRRDLSSALDSGVDVNPTLIETEAS